MSSRRHVTPVLPCLVPGTLLAIGWEYSGQPMHDGGLGAVLVLGVVLGIMVPGLLVSAEALPSLLVPSSWRIWYRHRHLGRPAIPAFLRRAVYAADRYCCCYCGDTVKLQLDHIKPWSRGGLSALWNLAVLCQTCNVIKSNYWIDRRGYVIYKPFEGARNMAMAAAILTAERRARVNPFRWIRASWSLLW